jgi:hypothetical protein
MNDLLVAWLGARGRISASDLLSNTGLIDALETELPAHNVRTKMGEDPRFLFAVDE